MDTMSSLRPDQYLSAFCVGVGLLLVPLMATRTVAIVTEAEPVQIQLNSAAIPVFAGDRSGFLNYAATLSADAVYVMDVPSSSILLEKNSGVPLSPASTTKLMTALVAVDAYDMDRVLTFDPASQTTGTTIGLRVGEEMTVQDLLQGLLIQSGNDAAMVLANNYPGGYAGFVAAMNQKAADLHLNHTSFTNPAGLDSSQHVSSARDMAVLGLEVIKHPILSQIVKTKASTVRDVTMTTAHPLVNTNALLARKPEIVGIKTGTTPLAGEVLISRYQTADYDLIAVVMGSRDRYSDTLRLLDWVFSHYTWVKPDSVTLSLPTTE